MERKVNYKGWADYYRSAVRGSTAAPIRDLEAYSTLVETTEQDTEVFTVNDDLKC